MSTYSNNLGPQAVASGGQSVNYALPAIKAQRAPGTNDKKYPYGQLWLDLSSNNAYYLAKVTSGSASWKQIYDSSTSDLSISGNLSLTGAAKQIKVEGGAVTDFIGQATLASGTITVANTNIAAADKVFVQRRGVNGSTALGVFNVAISAATSFTITALKPADGTTETGDTSIVDYFIVRQL